MPGLWIASVFIVLALEVAPATADSLSTAPGPESVGPDTLVIGADTLVIGADHHEQVAAPVPGDSLQLPSAVEPFPPLAPVPSLLPPPPAPTPLPTPGHLPKRNHFAAQRRGYFTPRTLWAAGYLGGSFLLYNRGSDYRSKADDFYARYKQESDPAEIEKFYQRTTTQDTKGQVCWALSAALAINGLRLLFTHETEVVSSEVSQTSLQMILAPQSLQLRVRKWL